jgi:AraC-like DNA-binding protein/mannose-6-phosphate isomerase-like protein (cupin superfamily)
MDKEQYEMYHENKEHTPPDFPYNIYFCSIPLDFRNVKTHWHDEIEIIVIKKGEGVVCVNLNPYNVKAGDIVFVFSGQLHSIGQKENSSMEYENIIFKPALLKSSGQDCCNDVFIQSLFSGKIKISPVIESDDKLIYLINCIDKICDERPYSYQLAVKGYMFMIIHILLSEYTLDTSTQTASEKSLDKIKTVLTYIADNYQRPITVEEMANKCFYSKSYFMKFFKETMGMGFIQYLNDYRLETAAALLVKNDGNIIDTAIAVGFDNLSYFNRCFKRKFGTTPKKYKSEFQNM